MGTLSALSHGTAYDTPVDYGPRYRRQTLGGRHGGTAYAPDSRGRTGRAPTQGVLFPFAFCALREGLKRGEPKSACRRAICRPPFRGTRCRFLAVLSLFLLLFRSLFFPLFFPAPLFPPFSRRFVFPLWKVPHSAVIRLMASSIRLFGVVDGTEHPVSAAAGLRGFDFSRGWPGWPVAFHFLPTAGLFA